MTPHIAKLPQRAVLEISGEDKSAFLQGLITNDIHLVTTEKAIYATLLTPQGRYLFDFFIIEKGDSYLLDYEASRREELIKKLSLYKLRSRITLTPRPDFHVYAVWGEPLPGSFSDPRLPELGNRFLGNIQDNTSVEDYDLHRIKLGVPEGGCELTPEKSIILEFGLDELNAISWTKGCYVGQELTARTKHMGELRKRLFPVEILGETHLLGTEVLQGEESVGVLLTHQKSFGLALLRVEALKDEMICGKAKLKPYIPQWMRLDK